MVTPDRESFITELAVGEVYDDIKRMHNGRLPIGLTEDDTYLAKHSEQGPFVREELLELARKADADVQARPARRITGKLDEKGIRRPVGGRSAPAIVEQALASDQVWVVVYSSTGERLGDQIEPPSEPGILLVGGLEHKLFSRRCYPVSPPRLF